MEEQSNAAAELINEWRSVSFIEWEAIFSGVSEMNLRRGLEYPDPLKQIVRIH
ncbi:hypothetical protein GPL15_14270 [Clostridium sp. MCC353]|uniref:hypothetical protein n=1 Tax=Clostridium sp. MCC353 TaxID=2592646 RepID=UPI001C01F2E5|nr:hypothetical protein [Clostridium sp. MCC353]MBT9777666.1 hypothetical protein [Clostridium sp. MCC353]